MKKPIMALVLLALFALSAAAPSAFSQTTSTTTTFTTFANASTFVTAIPANPSTLNPGITTSLFSHTSADAAFDSLIESYWPASSNSEQLLPGLANSWTVSPDGLTYTFNLVHNATWQDGVKFTSADVKYTFLNVLIPYHPDGGVFFGSVVKSITTPDNYTVVFNLNQTRGSLLSLVSNTWNAPILPAHLYNGTNVLTNPHNMNPIGTGPYVFQSYTPGSAVIYTKNPNYFRADPQAPAKLVIQVIPDLQTQNLALESGAVNELGFNTSPAQLQQLIGKPGTSYNLNSLPAQPGETMLYFNLNDSILKNYLVREAIGHAINRTQLSQVARYGYSPPALGGVVHPGSNLYTPTVTPNYAYNLTLAKQELVQAGYPNGFTINLNDVSGAVYNADAQVVVSDLAQVGITVNHQVLDLTTGNTQMFTQLNFQMGIRQAFVGPDPTLTLAATFLCTQVGKGTYTNAMQYCNKAADALLLKAQSETGQQQIQDMQTWQNDISADLPVFPLIYDNFPSVWTSNWTNIPMNPWGSQTMFAQRLAPAQATTQTVTTPPPVTTTTPPVSTASTPPSSAAAPSADYTAYYAAAVVVIIIIIAIAFVAMRRKGSPAPAATK